jgi:hypothetical protein
MSNCTSVSQSSYIAAVTWLLCCSKRSASVSSRTGCVHLVFHSECYNKNRVQSSSSWHWLLVTVAVARSVSDGSSGPALRCRPSEHQSLALRDYWFPPFVPSLNALKVLLFNRRASSFACSNRVKKLRAITTFCLPAIPLPLLCGNGTGFSEVETEI